MGTRVDSKVIIPPVRIAHILTRYGVPERLKRKGENLIGPCPIHQGTPATQFRVSLAKNNFHCLGDCHGGGNVIDFCGQERKPCPPSLGPEGAYPNGFTEGEVKTLSLLYGTVSRRLGPFPSSHHHGHPRRMATFIFGSDRSKYLL